MLFGEVLASVDSKIARRKPGPPVEKGIYSAAVGLTDESVFLREIGQETQSLERAI